jgi:hypothetical protein
VLTNFLECNLIHTLIESIHRVFTHLAFGRSAKRLIPSLNSNDFQSSDNAGIRRGYFNTELDSKLTGFLVQSPYLNDWYAIVESFSSLSR